MDEIPLPLRPALKSPYPTDEEVIRRIHQAVAAKPPLVPPVVPSQPRLPSASAQSRGRRTVATANSMLRITGGKVYDPANGVNGEVQDVCICDGRIVADVEGGRTIDATGMIVFPGGVDVHTHVAGAALNFARGHDPGGPPPHARRSSARPSAAAASAARRRPPSPPATSTPAWATRRSTRPPCPILSAKHTHEELRDTPIVDKTCCVLMANNEILLDLIEAGELERAKHVVAWHIWAAKAYGVKAVNPGGVTAWKWGKDAKQLHEPVAGYSKVTPAKIISALARIVDELGLPHPLHLHCNNLGAPGNVATTLETMKVLEGNRAHMAHLQYHAYGGDDWHTMRSESAADRRVLQRPPEPDDRRRRGPVRQHGDDHRRRPLAAPALQAHRPQVGQPRRRERDRLRHRPLRLQGEEPRQRRAVGRRAGAAAAHRRPVARLPDHRPPQRGRVLALPRDHPAADGRRLPPRAAEEAAAEGASSGSCCRT